MEVGVPGEGPEPPRSPEPQKPRSGAGHAARWVLAAVGAGCAYLLAQIVALVALNLALPSTDIDRLTLVVTMASLALAAFWWRRLRPQARLRPEAAPPERRKGEARHSDNEGQPVDVRRRQREIQRDEGDDLSEQVGAASAHGREHPPRRVTGAGARLLGLR